MNRLREHGKRPANCDRISAPIVCPSQQHGDGPRIIRIALNVVREVTGETITSGMLTGMALILGGITLLNERAPASAQKIELKHL